MGGPAFGPGGESDISARLQQPFFKEKFGQDLVIWGEPQREALRAEAVS